MNKMLLMISGILLLSCPQVYASPESVGYYSASVWSADGRGDFTFKGNGEPRTCVINADGEVESAVTGSYEPANTITAEAVADKITASWDSSGIVDLEVSADGGLTYAKAVNGVPVAVFAPGKQLRWRAGLGQDSVLREVRLKYTSSTADIRSFGSPELSGFSSRKRITVTNEGPETLFNYQVKIRISKGLYDRKAIARSGATPADVYLGDGVQALFPDIRFTSGDGETALGYYVETVSETAGQPYADVWVKVPQIPAGGVDIYLYYGNADAASASSGSAAFELFDDFPGVNIDAGQWTVTKQDNGAYSVADSWLKLSRASITHKKIKLNSGVIEYACKDSSGNTVIKKITSVSDGSYVSLDPGAGVVECDWLRLRKTASIAPGIAESCRTEKEEKVEMPVFINTTVKKNGDLALKNTAIAGTYRSAFCGLGSVPRIFTPHVDLVNNAQFPAKVGVSFNGGTDFLDGIEDGATYYASQKDFVAGTTLVWTLSLSEGAAQNSASAELRGIVFEYTPGKITVVYPNGGETLPTDTPAAVRWSADDYNSSFPMKIEYSADGGKNYTLVADSVANTGTYSWQAPAAGSSRGIIKISDSKDNTAFDVSDKVFHLVKGPGDYIGGKGNWHNASNWGSGKVPDLSTDVKLENGALVYADKEVAFKSLVIGDGEGKSTSILILRSTINPASGDITIRKGGQLFQESKLSLEIAGDLTVQAGGVFIHSGNNSDPAYEINLTAKNIFLAADGLISADAKGYAGGAARNSGKGKSVGVYDRQSAGTGGSHGGAGGGSKGTEGAPSSYDALIGPSELGSGGAGGKLGAGGAGGGVIKLVSRNEFSISGSISANGADGQSGKNGASSGGGGAGGSIYLIAVTFSGKGAVITAAGGSGHSEGGGGGGGRVYIQGQKGEVKGTINVNGGDGFKKGSAGSIVFK